LIQQSGRQLSSKTKDVTFYPDHVFGPDTTDKEVFLEIQPFLESAWHEAHVAVVAYGLSGTGKSTTIRGVLQQVGAAMFSDSDDNTSSGELVPVFMSYTELYQDKLYDVMPHKAAPRPRPRCLDTGRSDRSLVVPGSVSVGAEKVPIRDTSDLLETFAKADKRRKIASTHTNAESSRSHAFFTLFMPPRKGGDAGSVTFIDLAGHERQGVSGSDAPEAKIINQGLRALNNSLRKLVEQQSLKRGPKPLSPANIWSSDQHLLPRIVGGILTNGGAGMDERELDGRGRGNRLKSKVCLLGTVDLREVKGLQPSITTLADLSDASGIKRGS
jgi:kinesin family protein 18/19